MRSGKMLLGITWLLFAELGHQGRGLRGWDCAMFSTFVVSVFLQINSYFSSVCEELHYSLQSRDINIDNTFFVCDG